nr:methyltransferase domain-containing protein [Myxococcota bacterium]
MYVPLLDRLLYRSPFEGGSAQRYARRERPAFGDLDDRLLDAIAPALTTARRLLDLGCGPGTFSRAARLRHPALQVVAVDPSRAFAD